MIINHNMNAMNAHRNMMGNVRSAGKSMEKLSSGLRINRAGDDAAGLAISEKMRAQVRGLDQASRNAQDGISMIQTAEGALNETHSILQRMRELATQAANDTNNTEDRQQIQKEINQLTSEINRIGNTTEFNTQKMLDGGEAAGKADATKGGEETKVVAGKFEFKIGTMTDNKIITIGGEKFTKKSADKADAGEFKDAAGLKAAIEKNATLSAKYDVTENAGTITLTQKAGKESSEALTLTTDDAANKATIEGSLKTVEEGKGAEGGAKEAKAASKAFGDLTITAKEAGKAGNDIKVEFKEGGTAGTVTAAVNDGVITVTGVKAELTNKNIKEAIEANDDAKKLVSVEVATGKGTVAQKAAAAVALEGGADKSEAEGFTATLQIGANKGQAFKMEIADMRSEALGISQKTSGAKEAGDAGETKGEAAKAAEGTTAIGAVADFKISAGKENADKGNIKITFAEGGTAGAAFGADGTLTVTLDQTEKAYNAQKIQDIITGQDYTSDANKPDGIDMSKFTVKGGGALDASAATVNESVTLAGGVDAKAAEKADGAEKATGAVFTKTGAVTNGTDDENVESALDVTSHKNATNAIDVLNTAINTVSTERSKLGAYQNRLEHTINNLGTSSENLQAAESRIRDVDMASEMMTFSKNNILQQAAQAMLAQANQQPQGVLQLLR